VYRDEGYRCAVILGRKSNMLNFNPRRHVRLDQVAQVLFCGCGVQVLQKNTIRRRFSFAVGVILTSE
jgi:hypothetical protein